MLCNLRNYEELTGVNSEETEVTSDGAPICVVVFNFLASHTSPNTMFAVLISTLVSNVDLTTFALLFMGIYITWKFYQSYNLPPGPLGLPVFGYLPFMGKRPAEEVFNELSQKYGNIMSVQLGSNLAIVLGNYEAIKDAYIKQGDVFAGRPQGPIMKVSDEEAGVVNSDGEPWKEHRRFILSTLRDYGMGKLSMEPKIMEEIHYFLNELAKADGKPFDLANILGMSTANIICTLEYGKRFDYSDARYIKLCEMLDEIMRLFSRVGGRGFYPWIDYLPFSDKLTNLKRMRYIRKSFKMFVNDLIEEHKEDYVENSRKDLVDAFFTEKNSVIDKIGEEGNFNAVEITYSLMALFNAGTETTTSTLRWALLFMMIHPEIQMKIQNEIDDVIGLERDPTMSDKTNMVYTEAVLLEVQRCASLVPLNVPRANIEATELDGYTIPKRSIILTNIWAVHHDPELWDQPDKFMPERFINKEGRVEKPEFLIPFGIGKRVCVGESLARMELFLYFTSLLQRFTFEPPSGTIPTLAYESVKVRCPKPYKLRAVQRPEYVAG